MVANAKILLLYLLLPTTFLFLFALSCLLCYCRRLLLRPSTGGLESGEPEPEQLIRFAGGEGLTVPDILEAPGEVVGRSTYGTLYRASLGGSPVLLRFLRPAACGADVVPTVRALGGARHGNLVPVRALYVGPRGEKLLVHPYYPAGTLARFLRDGVAESYRWEMVCRLSLGIARGMNHLHTGLSKPIVHGNLKTHNVLLDADLQPRLSDFGIHLLLSSAACQEMLELAAAQGYKAPELIRMEEAGRESDIYSLGVILLEMLTRKEPAKCRLPTSCEDLAPERKIGSNVFSSELIVTQRQSKSSDKSANGQGPLHLFQLAMACCSPSPALRPGITTVVQRLEEIAS